MNRVFADASSLILLEKTELFAQCISVYPFITCTRVYDELTQNSHPGAEKFVRAFKAGHVTVIDHCFKNSAHDFPDPVGQHFKKLDTGEKDLISLFLINKSGFIMIDDGPAAKFCLSQGIPFINALLVPKIFWYAGIIRKNEYRKLMADLIAIGRYSEKVKAMAKGLDKKDLTQFLPWKN